MIDSHQHLYDPAFDADRKQVVQRALDAGVTSCILPGIDKASYSSQKECQAAYPDFCHTALGLHPTSVGADWKQELDFAQQVLQESMLSASPAVAIGEIGLDCYWSQEYVEQQLIVFQTQLEWAAYYHLPVIIHARDCTGLLLDTLKKNRSLALSGVLHAWSGSRESFQQATEYGNFKMGIGGVLTYKNAHLPQVVRQTPLEDILLETDSPWLTPVPFRGKRNECSYIRYVLEAVAAIKELPPQDIDRITTQNTLSLFSLKD